MKSLLLALLVGSFGWGTAQAETVTALQLPQRSSNPANLPYSCAPASFDATDNIHGSCQTQTSRSCGGRGCTVWTWQVYTASWDVNGNLLSLTHCGTRVNPGIGWTYQPGYDASTCQQPGGNSGPFALIDDYWYTIKAYSSDVAYEAGSGNSGPVVVAL